MAAFSDIVAAALDQIRQQGCNTIPEFIRLVHVFGGTIEQTEDARQKKVLRESRSDPSVGFGKHT